jgi:ADP-ribose pyrophosphatase
MTHLKKKNLQPSSAVSSGFLLSSIIGSVLLMIIAKLDVFAELGVSANDDSVIILGSAFTFVILTAALLIARETKINAFPIPKPEKIPEYSSAAKNAEVGELGGLDMNEILEMSFEYAKGTADQAMEHRMTIVNFYLLIVGGAGSGVIALIANTKENPFLVASAGALLWMVTIIGWLTLLKLIRLRAAWTESATEMSHIKAFYIENVRGMPSHVLKSAFFFSAERAPTPYKPWSIFHYSALLIALLDAVSFVGGIAIFIPLFGISTWDTTIVFIIILTIFHLGSHMAVYDIILKPRPPKENTIQESQGTGTVETSAPTQIKNAKGTLLAPSIKSTSFSENAEYEIKLSAPAHEITGSHSIFKGNLINIRVDDIRESDGSSGVREIVEHPPAIAIVPYFNDTDEILFIEQYRDAIQSPLLEIPAGMVNENEDLLKAAKRELLEETGLESTNMRHLCTYYTSPGFTNEKIHVFLATGLTSISDIQDTREIHGIHRYSREQVIQMLDANSIQDGKTILGLLWSLPHLITQV